MGRLLERSPGQTKAGEAGEAAEAGRGRGHKVGLGLLRPQALVRDLEKLGANRAGPSVLS